MLRQTCCDIAVIGAPSQDWNGTNTVSPDSEKDVFLCRFASLFSDLCFCALQSSCFCHSFLHSNFCTFLSAARLRCPARLLQARTMELLFTHFPSKQISCISCISCSSSRATFERSRFQKVWPPNSRRFIQVARLI